MTEKMDDDFSVGGTARKLRALEDALAASRKREKELEEELAEWNSSWPKVVYVERQLATLEAEVAEWRRVFGHLGNTADGAGNAIIAKREALEAEVGLLRNWEEIVRTAPPYVFDSGWWRCPEMLAALNALDQFREHETK